MKNKLFLLGIILTFILPNCANAMDVGYSPSNSCVIWRQGMPIKGSYCSNNDDIYKRLAELEMSVQQLEQRLNISEQRADRLEQALTSLTPVLGQIYIKLFK